MPWPTFGRDGENTKDGTGGVFSAATVTVRVVLVERPPESVTVSFTVREPAEANGWLTCSPVASVEPLLSKSHA